MRIWNLFGIIESHFGFPPYDVVLFLSIITTDACGDSWLLLEKGDSVDQEGKLEP